MRSVPHVLLTAWAQSASAETFNPLQMPVFAAPPIWPQYHWLARGGYCDERSEDAVSRRRRRERGALRDQR
jgi:hypothetical protein